MLTDLIAQVLAEHRTHAAVGWWGCQSPGATGCAALAEKAGIRVVRLDWAEVPTR